MRYHPIDAKQVKQRIAQSRAQMVLVMARWKQSGTGSAMIDTSISISSSDDTETGAPNDGANFKDDDDRSIFLISEKPHILYL